MMKKFLFGAVSVIIFSLAVAAQSPQPVATNSENKVEGRESVNDLWRETFDVCWRKINDTHFDPTFGGVDWDQVRRKYEPRLSTLKSEAELHRMLQAMLGELGQSHFNVIPPEAALANEKISEPGAGIGVDLRIIDGRVVISRVEPGSTAAAAGLRPGFIIKSVESRDIKDLKAQLAASPMPDKYKLLMMVRWVMSEIGGAAGTRVRISYLDAQDRSGEAVISREKLKGELSPPMGNFAPQYTEFEANRLPGNIGYIRFNIFTTPVMQKVRDAIKGFSSAPGPVAGVILDLRGNPGGIGGMAPGIAGMLSTEPGNLGTMKMRGGELKFAFFPQQFAFTGPVAILIDGLSASTSEIFAAGMQEIKRAAIVGEKSLGAALPSYFFKLPTGAMLQYAIADFKTPKGVLVEGRGVIPDQEVKLDRAGLLAGRDAQYDAAMDLIRSRSSIAR